MMLRLLPIFLVVTFHFSLAWAQVTSGSVLGTVQDATGAVLPGTEVVITHLDTGISRTVISDDEGRYQVTNLSLGNYEIAASLPGFQTEVRTGIEMTIGRRAVVNFSLNVGEITERVVVTGEAPLVETTSGSLGSLVDRHTVLELPLNGRDMTSLLTLQAGTVFVTTGGQNANSGFSRRVSISGARPQDSSVLLDGTGVKSLDVGIPAGVSGNFLGGEGVQEFKIERNSYSAQYGGASGGIINVVSKAGTNEFHGSLYEFHRNDNLDATNFFVNRDLGGEKPPFIRNQFGFSVGGPVIKNKTFFFWNYEGLRDRESRTSSRFLPTQATRDGRLPLEFDADGIPSMVANAPLVPVPNLDPVVLPYFDLWPLPGPLAEDQGEGVAREFVNNPRPTDENYYQLRVDHNFSDSDSLFGRMTWQDSERLAYLPINWWFVRDFVDNDALTLEEKHIFSPQFLNTFRFGYGRRSTGQSAFENCPTCDASLRWIPDEFWKAPMGSPPVQGRIRISGVANVGLEAPMQNAGWVNFLTTNYQWQDDFMYNLAAHSLKFGFSWNRVHTGGDNPSRLAGVFTFEDLLGFLQNDPSRFRGNLLPGSDGLRNIKIDFIGWYIQDDWQVTPKLTANLGFRYEFYTVPTEKDGKLSNLKDPLNDSTITMSGQILDANGDPTGIKSGESWFKNPSLKSFMPRIGFAYDPTGSGKTAIRLGAGLFYNHIQPDAFRRGAFRTAPFMKEQNFTTNVAFPGIFDQVVNQGIGAVDIGPIAYDYLRNPHMYQWNLNIQREVLPGAAATIGYAGSRGFNLMHQTCINAATADNVNGRYVFADDAAVPNQTFSDLCLRSVDADIDSWYHGLQAGFQRRFQAGWQLQLSYTFSKAVSEGDSVNSLIGNSSGGGYYWDPDMRRGLAGYHVGNVFSASGVWELPFGLGKAFGNSWSGVTEKVLGGWQLSGILSLAGGPARSIRVSSVRALSNLNLGSQTPDLVEGKSLSPVLGTKDSFHYFDVSGFVPVCNPSCSGNRMIGNVGSNTLIGPGVANLDFSLTNNTQVLETVKVQFRAEFFNIFNRTNFGLPDASLFRTSGSANPNAGRLNGTTTQARQIQFGLRIVF